ncbi:hypothetical protein D1970_11190 [Mesobacillus zeae]|uniref:Uncharacterized protein n=2 Tax=Mesobacillus zeae TaxID=1917180 RepID=A0A398B4X9_9BACI|nr:hypothetical protein D1970_11190 [Mesobacillus zeae]
MKLRGLAVTLLTAVTLAACGGGSTNEDNASKDHDTKNVKELVQDYSSGNKKAESASITSEQLLVKDSDGNKHEYDLPKDEFFVSIAPYVNETHP